MEGSLISADVLGTYAADAACEVEGVRGLVDNPLTRSRGVRVVEEEGAIAIELQLAIDAATNVPEVGRAVQERVAEFLVRMAGVRPRSVDVVIAVIRPTASV
ncbi:MAG TPA: Asp23/Gls24 family envelope stress response protein [Gaiellaceae bacterium]|nr:Asp23/Gls24 family envelope stress response protein [Gaiellaceae bacterium]